MKYCVCQNKDNGSLFITTRNARETMISVMIDLGQQPDSVVLKEVDDYTDAQKYLNEITESNNLIKKAIEKK